MAVPYVTVGDFIDNLRFQCDADVNLAGLSNYLELYKILYPDLTAYTFAPPIGNELLKKLTGCVVATETDVNCYPLGLTTAILFDADGNPLP